jgi:hypothetical protein
MTRLTKARIKELKEEVSKEIGGEISALLDSINVYDYKVDTSGAMPGLICVFLSNEYLMDKVTERNG